MLSRWFRPGDAASRRPLVAIINTSEEVCELLTQLMQMEGIATVSAYSLDFKRGRQDQRSFFANYDPPVVIYDVAIPYVENWEYFQRLRESEVGRGRTFVITTTNQRALAELVGETAAVEIIGKPYDLELVVNAVRRSLEEQGFRAD